MKLDGVQTFLETHFHKYKYRRNNGFNGHFLLLTTFRRSDQIDAAKTVFHISANGVSQLR